MLCNPLNRVIFRNKALDYFRFAIGPQNIDPPARTGIFPRYESWSLLGHPWNMRLRRHGSRQLSCHNYPRESGICGLSGCRWIPANAGAPAWRGWESVQHAFARGPYSTIRQSS
jgi:hypothetical protein